MPLKLYNPFVFQGNLKNRHYFEGWYFKHTSADQQHTWSFIPGISLNPADSHSFIQVIDGTTGSSDYIRYPLADFRFDTKKRHLGIHDSVFAEEFIDISISGAGEIKGRIEYSDIIRYPRKILSPGIMGWYSFVPRMECKHGVISVNHRLSGGLTLNGKQIDFSNGKGYIEKDWGTSFPEAWIWIQSNHFRNSDASFFFSVAKIPWLGRFFMGFISFLFFEGQFFSFCTYNNAKISKIRREHDRIMITLENKKHVLHINTLRKDHGDLKAPFRGEMTRKIKESINSEVSVKLLDQNGCILFNDTGHSAGLEIIDKIFEYV